MRPGPSNTKVPSNFLGLPPDLSDPQSARFVVLPAPYDGTTTFLKGTRHGPGAVITASQQVELYDDELGEEIVRSAGVATLPAPRLDGLLPEAVADILEALAAPHLAAGRTLVTVGGEHSVSLGPIRALKKLTPRLTVLQVDAHCDLRDEYAGTRHGHACVMRRVLEDVGAFVVQVGVRALSREEACLVAAERVKTFFARDLAREFASAIPRVISAVSTPHVYLSVDVDGFDPSVVPGTGTPEPGGLGWWDVLALARALASARRILAFDVVETLPSAGQVVSEFAAARLIYKIMGYVVRGAGWRPA